MDVPRTRGHDPKEGDELYLDLMRVCANLDRDFLKAKHLAEMIATGKLTMEQSVTLVIHEMERAAGHVALREGRVSAMSIEDALGALEHELEIFEERAEREDAELERKVAELKERQASRFEERRRLENGIKALKGAQLKTSRRSSGSSGRAYTKEPCPWPGCGRDLAPQGRRKHLDKHAEKEGITLEQAIENAAETAA